MRHRRSTPLYLLLIILLLTFQGYGSPAHVLSQEALRIIAQANEDPENQPNWLGTLLGYTVTDKMAYYSAIFQMLESAQPPADVQIQVLTYLAQKASTSSLDVMRGRHLHREMLLTTIQEKIKEVRKHSSFVPFESTDPLAALVHLMPLEIKKRHASAYKHFKLLFRKWGNRTRATFLGYATHHYRGFYQEAITYASQIDNPIERVLFLELVQSQRCLPKSQGLREYQLFTTPSSSYEETKETFEELDHAVEVAHKLLRPYLSKILASTPESQKAYGIEKAEKLICKWGSGKEEGLFHAAHMYRGFYEEALKTMELIQEPFEHAAFIRAILQERARPKPSGLYESTFLQAKLSQKDKADSTLKHFDIIAEEALRSAPQKAANALQKTISTIHNKLTTNHIRLTKQSETMQNLFALLKSTDGEGTEARQKVFLHEAEKYTSGMSKDFLGITSLETHRLMDQENHHKAQKAQRDVLLILLDAVRTLLPLRE